MSEQQDKNSQDAIQILTFNLGEEVFAVDISKVREVLEFSDVTRVPRTPASMLGVINLRGSVVPVVDMRRKFGMQPTEKTVNTCIIIVEINQGGDVAVMGALADSVKEVITLEQNQIEPPPKIGTNLRSDFLRGMGKQEDHFIMLLDIDRIFSNEEMSAIQDSAA